jgi:cell wall-associated NlpC family hydrolase
VSSQISGRHRAPSPLSSASSFSSAISRSAKPATKTSAVIVISGAMVASLALPASAATPSAITATAPVALSVAVAGANPSAAQAPLAPRTFGNIAFTGVVKPKPKPVVIKRVVVPVSRSVTRAPISATSTPTQNAAPASNTGGILGMAASLAGIYYIYGGTTTAGFDCSGFTQYVFAKMGISLPRTAEQQRQAVTPVTNPQPGDLVFFGSPAYHVGIYAGNGTMWDSPHSGSAIAKRAIWSSTPTYGRP